MAHVNRLRDAHVFIFGGTAGIGYAIASMALSNGARVTISGSQQPKVDTKVEELRSLYPNLPSENVAGYACDLTDIDNLETNLIALFDKATNGGSKKIDHITFSAGDRLGYPTLADATPKNLIIAKLLTTDKYMPRTVNSSFTTTSGTNTHKPFPGWTFVAVVGGSAEGLVRGLAIDLKPIRVNVVSPGMIQTELLQPKLDEIGEAAAEMLKKENSLTESFGQPGEIAEAYGYLMKDRYSTGSRLTSDGGRLLVPNGPPDESRVSEHESAK